MEAVSRNDALHSLQWNISQARTTSTHKHRISCYHSLQLEQWSGLLKSPCTRTMFLYHKEGRAPNPRKLVKWMLFKKSDEEDSGYYLLTEDGTDQHRFCGLQSVKVKHVQQKPIKPVG